MSRTIQKGATNQSIEMYIIDSTDGTPETGVLWNTAGIDLKYRREGAAVVNITEAELASSPDLTDPHVDGGFLEIGNGVYRLDLPDAAVASGADSVVMFGTVTGMIVLPVTIQLVNYNPMDATRLGLTAIPDADADAAGGLPVSDSGGLDMDSKLANTNEVTAARMGALTDWINGGRLDLLLDAIKIITDALPDAGALNDLDDIQTRLPAALVSGRIDANVGAISDDAVAADNLKLMYNGTGYTDDTAPSSRSQVAAIGSGGGGALNFANESDNIDSAIKGITFDGVETSGTNASVNTEDGTYHNITHSANNIDIVYQFDVGGDRGAVNLIFRGYLNSNNDVATIQAYNGTGWDTIATLNGQNGVTNLLLDPLLLSEHTGTGADLGKVYIRIECAAQTSPDLFIDQLVVEAVSLGSTLGFVGGAVWVDTVNGIAGTGEGVGTISIPSGNIADARTIADSNNLRIVQVIPGSSFTLAQSFDNFEFIGHAYSIALGGQSIDGAYFFDANISGIGISSSSGNKPIFEDCPIGNVTLPPSIMRRCFLSGTITNSDTGDWFINHCMSRTAGGTTAKFDFGTAVGNTNLNMRLWSGEIQLESMGDTGVDAAAIEGFGIIDEGTCTGGTVVVAGHFTISGQTNLTFSDNARFDIAQILSDSTAFNGAEIAAMIIHLTDIKGAGFVGSTDSNEAIRDRGDAAWTTGGGGSITDILNVKPVIPNSIDLANTATVRLGLMLTNALDDLPSTAEITPGTIDIDRKAIGGTSWSSVVSGAACLEQAGMIYFDEVFDSGTGYAEGDSIRVTFKSQKITVSANDYEVTDANGVMFQTEIRQTMVGTNSAALASICTEGRLAELDAANLPTTTDGIQTDLDNATDGLGALKILIDTVNTDLSNGTDGLGALKILIDDKTGYSLSVAGILAIWHQLNSAIVTAGSMGKLLKDEITVARMAVLTDWINGGRLDLLLDAIPTTAMRGTDGANTVVPDAAGVVPTAVENRQEMDSSSTKLAEITAVRMAVLTDWINGGRLDLILDAIPTTAMRGTDNAATEAKQDIIDTVVDAILVMLDDARGEPTQGAPPVNPDAMTKIDYLYKLFRNKKDNDGSTTKFYADDGTTVDHKQTTDVSGGIVTKGEIETGP